tara:strand:+ start:1167 stop:1316 length:150 start_codon:yes stop_codon:yes gene_type:complete
MTKEELIAQLAMYEDGAEIMISGRSYLADIVAVFGGDKEVIIHCGQNLV